MRRVDVVRFVRRAAPVLAVLAAVLFAVMVEAVSGIEAEMQEEC